MSTSRDAWGALQTWAIARYARLEFRSTAALTVRVLLCGRVWGLGCCLLPGGVLWALGLFTLVVFTFGPLTTCLT